MMKPVTNWRFGEPQETGCRSSNSLLTVSITFCVPFTEVHQTSNFWLTIYFFDLHHPLFTIHHFSEVRRTSKFLLTVLTVLLSDPLFLTFVEPQICDWPSIFLIHHEVRRSSIFWLTIFLLPPFSFHYSLRFVEPSLSSPIFLRFAERPFITLIHLFWVAMW